MRKKYIKSSLLAGLVSLLFSFSALKVGSITDISKPYLGEYECKSAELGKKDLLKDYPRIVLELCDDNTFVLRFQDKKGKKREQTGEYEYDKERGAFRFRINGKADIKREFVLENGKIHGALKLGWRTLTLEFEQK